MVDYQHRFGRDASGMACRYAKGERGRGVSSLRINRGSRTVVCEFSRLFNPRDVLADAQLEAAIAGGVSEPTAEQGGTARPDLAATYPGTQEFAVRTPDGPASRRETMRCPNLGDALAGGEQ